MRRLNLIQLLNVVIPFGGTGFDQVKWQIKEAQKL